MVESFDNPNNVQSGQTRAWDVLIRLGMESRLRDLHVAMPAQVHKVVNNSFVDIQPLLQRVMNDGTVLALPIVQGVPIKQLGGADWWMKGPVAVGDVGTMLIHERSLDAWIVKGGIVNPSDPRMHDLSDCEFIPGLPTQDKVLPGNADDMVLHNGSAEVILQKGGTFKVTNGSQELFDLIDQLISRVTDVNTQLTNTVSDISTGPVGIISTPAPGSPVPTSPVLIAALAIVSAQLSTISTQLATLKSNLDTLKGT